MGDAAREVTEAAWRPRHNPWLISIVVTLAAFMEILDTTIVNVSLPYIAGDLSTSYENATWTLTSYLVANGIAIAISGWFGRRLGRKRYFVISIVMFTACSFLCGTSTSLSELVVFRIMQGFFGGGLQPNQQAIVLDVMPPEKRGAAFGVISIAVVFAPIIGPTLGGWITDSYSWRWVFFVNIPIGIIAAFLVHRLVEDPPWVLRAGKEQKRGIDIPGLALIALAVGATQIMLDRGADDGWFGSPHIQLLALLAALGWIGAIFWLTERKQPLINLFTFRDRNFAVACGLIVAMYGVLYASGVNIPELAQQQLGYTAFLAGLVLTPGSIAVLLEIPFITRFVLPNFQTRHIVAFGFTFLGFAMFYMSRVNPSVSYDELVKMRILQSVGFGFLFIPISTAAYMTLPRELNTDAAALYVFVRNIAGSAAISLSTAFVTMFSQSSMAHLSTHLNPANPGYDLTLSRLSHAFIGLGYASSDITAHSFGWLYQALQSQAAFDAYRDLFQYCGIIAFLAVPCTFLFTRMRADAKPPAKQVAEPAATERAKEVAEQLAH